MIVSRHTKIVLICLVLTSVFIHVFLNTPLVFLIPGDTFLYFRLLPSVFSYLALLLGVPLEILEFAGRLSFKKRARTYDSDTISPSALTRMQIVWVIRLLSSYASCSKR